MRTLIQIKNRFSKLEAAYTILTHVKTNPVPDTSEDGPHLDQALESLEKELCQLDKSLYLLVHGMPWIVSVTDWVKAYRAKRKNL